MKYDCSHCSFISMPRRFKVVSVNTINNCCLSYATKALHLSSWPNRSRTVQSQNYYKPSKMQIVLYARALQWYHSFSPEVKKSQSSLHWDCIPVFIECNQTENQKVKIQGVMGQKYWTGNNSNHTVDIYLFTTVARNLFSDCMFSGVSSHISQQTLQYIWMLFIKVA